MKTTDKIKVYTCNIEVILLRIMCKCLVYFKPKENSIVVKNKSILFSPDKTVIIDYNFCTSLSRRTGTSTGRRRCSSCIIARLNSIWRWKSWKKIVFQEIQKLISEFIGNRTVGYHSKRHMCSFRYIIINYTYSFRFMSLHWYYTVNQSCVR